MKIAPLTIRRRPWAGFLLIAGLALAGSLYLPEASPNLGAKEVQQLVDAARRASTDKLHYEGLFADYQGAARLIWTDDPSRWRLIAAFEALDRGNRGLNSCVGAEAAMSIAHQMRYVRNKHFALAVGCYNRSLCSAGRAESSAWLKLAREEALLAEQFRSDAQSLARLRSLRRDIERELAGRR